MKEETRLEIVRWLKEDCPFPEGEEEKVWEDRALERIEKGVELILRALLESKSL